MLFCFYFLYANKNIQYLKVHAFLSRTLKPLKIVSNNIKNRKSEGTEFTDQCEIIKFTLS